jgi:hypothetical protein
MDYPAGWTCERTILQFRYYLLGTLSLAESLAVGEHLEACQRCSHRLVLYRLTLAELSHG